ncbi:hypothetical protein [Mesohalobacter salilacus]|uniref:hypothetical protein n=1 Tax=Mesohalobacter salilacus TaxID=2491711 RepID=UPI002695C1CD
MKKPTYKAIHIGKSHQPTHKPKLAKEYVFANAETRPKKKYDRTTMAIRNAGEGADMKKQRIYLDTSVFGGYYDNEFQEFTKPLFERIKDGDFKVLLSAVLQKELEPAPEKIVKLITDLKN